MQKKCKCGDSMNIRLRTVIYQSKIEIENVPIFTCSVCKRTEVFPGVKSDLTELIKGVPDDEQKQHLPFQEVNELAYLLYKVSDHDYFQEPVDQIVQERINELLDLLLLASSLEDAKWLEDIHRRLSHITTYALSGENVT